MEDVIEKGELAVMDHTGDTKTIWDPRNEAEVDAAEATFNTLKKKGYAIFKVNAEGEKGTKVNTFDPSAGKMIAVPPVVGG